ncbi:MAG: protein tyrosine phosphatase family protein [Hyphomonadaceae bacterium]
MSDPEHIYHWRRVDARLTTSGQPSETELAQLKQMGVTYIVNLGLHEHERALGDEATSVTDLGMEYTHIPVAFDAPTTADFDRFCEVMGRTGEAMVHVHCIANLRVTAFLYRYWRDVLGTVEEDARALMDSVWRPGGVWATFIGDTESEALEHRPPVRGKS